MTLEPFARTIAVGALAVLLFDLAGSYASRRLGFAYANLVIGSILIYGLVGFAAGQAASIRAGAVAGEAVAAIEATLGWAIAWRIGPGRVPEQEASIPTIARTILLVVATGAIFGAVGAAASQFVQNATVAR